MKVDARWMRWLVVVVLPLFVTACATRRQVPSDGSVELVQAAIEIPEEMLLDVGIQVFDPGLPEDESELPPSVFPEVRRSEARWIAIQLKETLQETGQWGAVRVVPVAGSALDVKVTGRIIQSSGKELVVHVLANDSTGRVWINSRYKHVTSGAAYDQSHQLADQDPFQALYHQISNDLVAARSQLARAEIGDIRHVSELQFAADLAPIPFSSYLAVSRKGRYEVARLPAAQDPMMDRVARIREREYMFVDTLNQHYANFYTEMSEPYDSWRQFSYEEQMALEKLRRKARTQQILGALAVLGAMFAQVDSAAEAAIRDAAALGGMAAIQAGVATSKEAKIHVEAIKELGASFEAEVTPLVIEVEGQTLRLSGSVETQYEKWRELLREIYATETALPIDPNTNTATDAR
jgi:hypothetical protein